MLKSEYLKTENQKSELIAIKGHHALAAFEEREGPA
jgi:hypothetical protein